MLFSACMIFLSCNRPEVVEYTPSLDAFLRHEWISFDVKTSSYKDGEWQYDRCCAKVVVHNAGTSREIAFFTDMGRAELLTSDKVTFIDSNYQVVAVYERGNEFYEELAVDMLQGPLDFFPMLYESNQATVVSYKSQATIDKIADGDTLYAFPATKLEKHCYTNGKCKLKDAPITLLYSTKQGSFVEARQSRFELFQRNEIISTISNIQFDDYSYLIDSLFNLENYKDFEFVSGTNFLPYRIVTSNTEANEEVLNYPIVNLRTGDTMTLGALNGSVVLRQFYFGLDEETYKREELALADADNIVWLMPTSNNVKKLNEMDFGDNIYYAKGFNFVLAEYRYYYIDETHHIVDYCDGRKFEQWINKTITKKQ